MLGFVLAIIGLGWQTFFGITKGAQQVVDNPLVNEAKEYWGHFARDRKAHRQRQGLNTRILCSAAFTPVWSMNYQELCKTVTGLHGSIEVAMVLSSDKVAASHLKSGGPVPDEDEFRHMISQIEMIVKATKANEDKFGDLGFITIHYKHIDGLFFPLNDHDTLIVGVVQPYDHDSLAGKILTLLARKK